MKKSPVENVSSDDVEKVKNTVEPLILEDVLKLGNHLDVIGKVQLKKYLKLAAESEDENVKNLLLQLAKVSDKVDAKISDLEDELCDYNGECECGCCY